VRAFDGSRARYVGTSGEVVLGWEVARGLTVEAAYSAYEAGPFIEQTGPAKTAQFRRDRGAAALLTTIRFAQVDGDLAVSLRLAAAIQ
jgi:hypothetical protein